MSLFIEEEKKWKSFLSTKIKDYGARRNYDYGPKEINYVCLLYTSPSPRD